VALAAVHAPYVVSRTALPSRAAIRNDATKLMRPDQRARLLFPANLLRFPAFLGGGDWNYTASPSNTALHRSWIFAERAFGQLASV
jgi:hypothetical protein